MLATRHLIYLKAHMYSPMTVYGKSNYSVPKNFLDGIAILSDVVNDLVRNMWGSLQRPQKSVNAIKAYTECMHTLIVALDEELDRRLSGREENSNFGSSYYIPPGPRSQETDGIQPLCFWILKRIACLLDEIQPNGQPAPEKQTVPPNKSVVREGAVVALDKGSHKRFGDIAVATVDQRLVVYPPDTLPLIVELKPTQRSSEKLFDILHGGEQRLAAHMSKSIAMCFNFGECGMNGHATSLLGSLSFVQ